MEATEDKQHLRAFGHIPLSFHHLATFFCRLNASHRWSIVVRRALGQPKKTKERRKRLER